MTNWFAPGYDDSAWPVGRALLYVETATLPAPKSTPLTLGRLTYYFRTTFVLPTNLVPLTLTASNLIDDGAVFYLNGAEVRRVRMPSGTVTYSTLASGSVDKTVRLWKAEDGAPIAAMAIQYGSTSPRCGARPQPSAMPRSLSSRGRSTAASVTG